MSKIIDGLTTVFVFVVSISFVWNESASLVAADRAGLSFIFGLISLYVVSQVYKDVTSNQLDAALDALDAIAFVDSPATVLDVPSEDEAKVEELPTLPELFAQAKEIKVVEEVVKPVQEDQPKAKRKYMKKAKPVQEVVQEVQEPVSKVEIDVSYSRTQLELVSTSESNSEPVQVQSDIQAQSEPAQAEVISIEPKTTKTAAKTRKTGTKTTVKEESDTKPKSSYSAKTTAKKSTSARRTSKAKSEATDKE